MKIKKFLSVLLTVMFAVGALALPATAQVKDASKDVSLTIYALETADGSDITVDANVTGEKITLTDKKPISGVNFNLYKVADNETSTAVPEGSTAITTGYTDENGETTVVIPAANQGRYLVVENEKPSNAVGTTVPFLVDLPLTNPQGTDFLYEVFVYPKQVVNYDTDSEPVSDTDSDVHSDTESDSDSDTDSEPFTTDTDTELQTDIDTSDSDTESDVPTPPDIPQPKVSKKVSDDNGKTWGDRANIAAVDGQKAFWKITAEVPDIIERLTIFNVGDILDSRLIAPKPDDVKASVDGKELPKSSYSVRIKGQTITVEFDAQALVPYKNKNIDVIFGTSIDLNAPNAIGTRIENIATLTFSRVADADITFDSDSDTENPNSDTDTDTITTTTTTTITSTTVEVWTGEIEGFKHDKDNKPLAGAEFTLYTDKACKNQVAKTTSDKDGFFYFKGLLDGTYYLKETKAPNGYQANTNVLEVKVDMQKTKSAAKVDVVNIPKTNLPITGGAGIIGISIIGLSISVLGAFVIYLALRVRRKEKYAVA